MVADLDLVRRLAAADRGLAIIATTRADGSVQSSLVNAGLLPQACEMGFSPVRVRVQPRVGEELVVERMRLSRRLWKFSGGPGWSVSDGVDGLGVLGRGDFAVKCSEQERELAVAADAAELLFGFEHAGGGPAQAHLA